MLTLDDIKNYLHITWADDETDSRVKAAAYRGQAAVGGLIGTPGAIFFMENADDNATYQSGEAEQLFLDAVRYIYNNAYEDFRRNFSDVILSLRAANTVAVKEAAEDAEESSDVQ